MERTQIVLLSGKQGSGKTTTSNLLAEYCFDHKWEHSIIKFAKPLYEMHDAIRDIALDYDIPMPEKDGKLLQLLGTEWGRVVYGDSLWTDIARKTTNNLRDVWDKSDLIKCPTALVIIDDCRFENEFDAFPEALRVRLMAPEDVRQPRTESWRDNTKHPSEVGLDAYEAAGKFDLVIDTSTCPAAQVLAQIMFAVGERAGENFARSLKSNIEALDKHDNGTSVNPALIPTKEMADSSANNEFLKAWNEAVTGEKNEQKTEN